MEGGRGDVQNSTPKTKKNQLNTTINNYEHRLQRNRKKTPTPVQLRRSNDKHSLRRSLGLEALGVVYDQRSHFGYI
jgi:hypothetical protein